MTFYMWFIVFSEAKGFGYGLVSRAVDSSFKPGGPIVESKPQIKRFTVVALDFPKNRDGQAHLAHTLTTTLMFIVHAQRPRTRVKKTIAPSNNGRAFFAKKTCVISHWVIPISDTFYK